MLTLTNINKYLNFYDYEYVPTFIEIDLINDNIPYVWVNASTLATGYKINTIIDNIVLPILTNYNISLKSLTNALILNEYYKRQRLILIRNKYKLLCKEFIILPEFLIIHILSFEFLDSHNCISIKV